MAENAAIEAPGILKELTQQMQIFAEHYAVGGVPLKAAILAGYAHSGATGYAYRLLDDPRIQAAVEYYKEVHACTSLYTPEKIKMQWSEMASFNILECCNDDYSLKNLNELTAEQKQHLGKALTGLKITVKNGKQYIEPKMARETALQELGKIHRLYADDKQAGQGLNLTINVGQQVVIDEALSENIGHIIMKDEEMA